jgi:colanic acid biosynthesis protein WcaH
MGKFLAEKDFIELIDRAPLVSIDLVITRPDGKVLLGKRVNSPAANTWFAPGGRIEKFEDVDEALKRISETLAPDSGNLMPGQVLALN